MSMHELPRKLPGTETTVSPLFRIGNPTESIETKEHGVRKLLWSANGSEWLRDKAGWGSLEHGTNRDGFMFINVPEGTRNAGGILGGVEGWPGEKAEIIDFLLDYIDAVFHATEGRVDTGLGLDTLAVTKAEGQKFVAPPHHLVEQTSDIGAWRSRILNDTYDVLTGDQNREQLVHLMTERTKYLAPPEN
jgi:hypothetical protein